MTPFYFKKLILSFVPSLPSLYSFCPVSFLLLKLLTFLILSSIIICVIGILMFAGTLYDVLFLQWPRWREEWRVQEENHINMFADNNDNRTSTTPSHVQDDDDDDEALLILKKDMQSHASEYTGEKYG